MKNLLLFLFFIFLSCKENQTTGKTDRVVDIKNNTKEKSIDSLIIYKHKIIKIDSIGNIYLIYSKKEDVYYKILSDKINSDDRLCNKVLINNYYDLKLKSIFDGRTRPSYKADGVLYNEQEIEFEKDSIYDLHFAENLRGLCIEDI